MIPIYQPYFTSHSLKYAQDALNSTWVSSHGKYIAMVEEKLQELFQIKYVLVLNSGTSACHLVAKTLSKLHNKTEIIVPNNVYVAAWNAFLFDNNYDLFAIDTDINTWNIDLVELDRMIGLRPNASVLIVHNLGNIINVPELQKRYPNTTFVEDNCEGLFGKYNGLYSGTSSYASAISFFGNKNITSGEGGAFLTNDESAHLLAKQLHGQGQSSQKFIHTELGYNYRMTNIQAGLLYGQLEILSEIIEKKMQVFNNYREALRDRDDIFLQDKMNNTQSANWMFGIRVPNNTNYQQAEIYFQANGIEIRPMFYPINAHQHLLNDKVHWVSCKNATQLQRECFILPSYPGLSATDQKHIIKTINTYIKNT